jgi:hypothetical protein
MKQSGKREVFVAAMRRSVATPAPFATRFDNEVGCGHVTTESHRVVLGLNGGGLCWGEAGGALRCVPDAHLQTSVARWFPSNAVLLSGGSDTILKVWDAEEEMEEGASLEAVALLSGQHKTGVLSAAMVGRGRTLVSGSRDCVALWDVSTQKALRTLGPGGEAWSLECLADETAVVAGGAAGQGRVLDLREARAATVALSTSAEAGALLCCQQEGDGVQFGTERGWLVQFDLRRPDAPVVQSRRADEARILCLFRGGFATSLGSVVRGTAESQVAEVGQPIVAVDAEGRVAVATDKIIFV